MYRWKSAGAAPIAALFAMAATGCFATKSDFNQLRDEIATVRAETATVDSVRAMQMVQLLSSLRALNDTLTELSTRLTRVRAETQSGIRDIGNRVMQVQEASGQSQQSIREMRAALEQRNRTPPPAPPPAPSSTEPTPAAADTTPPVAEEPGPNELFQIGRDQLARGGFTAAAAAFADLLAKYPDSELAPDAQFYLAESLAGAKKTAAADSAYATVVTKYPTSSRAPTALYKRGVSQQKAGRTATAKRTFNEVIRLFPESDEAALARERLRGMS
jgi:tol-pal system protein YbgF